MPRIANDLKKQAASTIAETAKRAADAEAALARQGELEAMARAAAERMGMDPGKVTAIVCRRGGRG
jgi:hypothetical protein